MSFGRFFLPGPTEVREAILRAMAGPMIPHRGSEFPVLFAALQEGLRPLFRTQRPVYVAASSATGLMEMGVRALPPGPVLALVNGAFSERFVTIAAASGREVDAFAREWGEVHDPDDVAKRLRARRYAGMTLVHSETSTGALQPLRDLVDVARREGVPVVADIVTSLAAAPFEMDAWGLSFACAGSQKALALPPGLALAAASEEFARDAEAAEGRGLYLDLVAYERNARENQVPFTPPLPMLYALRAQLSDLHAEGLEARWARHRAMAERCWAWAAEKGLGILAPEGFRAPAVTCIRAPEGTTGPRIARRFSGRGFTVAPGYGKLRDACFRIGHMGDHTVEELDALLAAW